MGESFISKLNNFINADIYQCKLSSDFHTKLLHLPSNKTTSIFVLIFNVLQCIIYLNKKTVFFLGLLSTPLPYLLLAVFYFFGFATGMFKGDADIEPITQVQVRNIQFEPQISIAEKSENTFQFHKYNFQKKVAYCAVQSPQPPPIPQNEKLIYWVHGLKIPHSFTSEYYFCRPPPTCS